MTLSRALGLAALLALLTPAAAAETVEETYLRYHLAVRAAVHCVNADKEFDPPSWSRLSAVIDGKVNYAMGAGKRLTLIEKAKSEMRDTVFKWGCKGDKLKPHLDLYRAELEPALP